MYIEIIWLFYALQHLFHCWMFHYQFLEKLSLAISFKSSISRQSKPHSSVKAVPTNSGNFSRRHSINTPGGMSESVLPHAYQFHTNRQTHIYIVTLRRENISIKFCLIYTIAGFGWYAWRSIPDEKRTESKYYSQTRNFPHPHTSSQFLLYPFLNVCELC